ncbi:LOW QUALITY PROTEIN: FRAS1-related extracellular matrix protein 2-like [Lethenteron reissneri]|uniref:LOW QUALITY PROTEIN: FRAS1-related extracellular matrix protein 2-like n=1 Tax=Lethenteron reissneri TaxID=7753 RepID=UPI002AB5EDBB|nr:LOW QUALITY PROTEIN: FRAS1-related extracellular matrix protein 2-like [Lethenteron reissneri]
MPAQRQHLLLLLVPCLLTLWTLSGVGLAQQHHHHHQHHQQQQQQNLHDPASYFGLRLGPSHDSIIVANNGVRVPFGRAVHLDPINDLVVQVQPGDRCSITVLDNDPLSQRPGVLSPKKFSCDFGPNDVKYSHFGSRSPAKDRVRLQLRYDTQTDTIVIPFMIEVEVVFTQLEVITRNMPLSVEKLMGTSGPIDKKILEFTYDRANEVCKLTSLAGAGGMPRYGRLTNADHIANGQMLTCQDFITANIRYQHTAATASPNRDYIPMVVELSDKDGNLLKQEYFQIMVRIREGLENTPPKPSFIALMMMEVDQFVMTAITPEMLAAEDVETDPDDLIFNITSPLGYQQGYIVSTDDRNLPITSFYQRDIKDLKIAYKPPAVDSNVERIFQIEFEVIDSEGVASDPFAFMIVVKPMNTLAPVVTRNTGQMLFEGQSRPLSSAQNLEISDEDNLENVRVTVIDGLRHGELTVLGARRKFFTPADLDAGVVVYQHDGSDTYSDNIIFRMTDGKHEVEFLFPITVAPTDDEPPVVNANTGLVISKNEIMQIPPFVLSAIDIDSEDSTIRFTVEAPFSSIGQVLLRQSEKPEESSSWKFIESDNLYEKVVTEWLQEDILEGKLFYRHVGPHSTSVVMDQFVFRVQDDNDPPNQSGEHTFLIKVQPIDDIPPSLYPGTTLQMTVQEFEITHFKRKFLRYTDLDSDDRDLKYTITKPPVDTDENNPINIGSIVLTENPDVVVSEFTQAQVNHHKIAYKPPDQELGITPHVVQFTYTVEDTAGNSVGGTFTIFLQPVDNKPPKITNTGFTVFERGTFVITNAELDATDTDTQIHEITFTLTQEPKYGQLQYFGIAMAVDESFILDDISNGRVAYIHNGDESTSDTFKLDVADGVHVVTIIIKVTVKPIDDEAPTIVIQEDTLRSSLDVLENGATEITTNLIKGTDRDTDDLMLTFIVEELPKLGSILVNGVPSERFTQQDMINGVVVYAHTSGEIGTQKQHDAFNLTISDMSDEWVIGGNKIQGVRVRVTILPVDSVAPSVTIGQPYSVIEAEKNFITLKNIKVEDVDTPTDDILCTIIVQPTSGYIENISPAPGSEKSRAGTPISAFTMKDVRLKHINYVQSIHKGVEPLEDRFTFRCSDGINFSPRHFFPITIIPANDEKPELFMREFIVMEGMSLIVDTPILNAADSDIPQDELHFYISKLPKHGQIVQQRATGTAPVRNFTLEEISGTSSIVYEHDDSETKHDNFTVRLSDGKHSVEKTVLIMVIQVDDETPRMAINDGLEIEIGETKVITNKMLKATDLDSEDKTLTYIIRFGPGQGLLQRLSVEGGVSENITLGMNFTQDEIDRGLIQYEHTGQEGIRDLIKFDVTDGINPLIDRYFYVSIGSIDMIFPDIINKGVSLKEGGKVTLTTNLLSTTDINSPDENLRFSITRAPIRGHMECTDNPGVPITSFTQLQLAGNKIYYIHTSDDEIKMDSFEFEVTDGYNPVFRTFRISISDVDNKKPVLTVHDLHLNEGEPKLITPFELTVEDRDTPDHRLRFTVTQVPVHGQLLYNGSRPVTSFTKQDLNENLISYKHDGTETSEDSFSFTVTDGTHTDFYVFPDTVFETRKPQMMHIRILSVDNGVPQIVVNRGASSLRPLPSGHLGFMLTNKALKAEDRDSSPRVLKYVVEELPEHGFIINLGLGNDSVSKFTQGDVDDMNICYVLREGDNATSDIFYFSVEDNGGNKLKKQPFRLNWAWISLEREYYLVDEDAKYLEVVLKRRGYLGETSFISIGTRDGTAEKEKDFKGKAQKQVQFNPGQTSGTWRVRIFADAEFETSETFQIVLSEPVMAALEYPDIATVDIVDPSDESTVYIPQAEYKIEEDIGELLIPIRRSGDVSQELMVICYTHQGTATGTIPTSVLSYSDYISRPEEHMSVLRFDRGEQEKGCRVVIIDDSLYEDEESFNVSLSMPMGGRVGDAFPSARILIQPDADDEPSFYFGEVEYHVDESAGFVEVRVWRTGTDLSKTATVTVRSRKTEPVSAEAGVDYVGISRNLDFAPGVTMQTLRVTILDDLGQPVLEGVEHFELVLRMPMNAVLGEPSKTTVFINDSVSDLPKVQFKDPLYTSNENDGQVSAVVYRSGDVGYKSTVRCFTRQGTAEVMMDFEERPNTDDSVVTFLPGEIEKPCTVILADDTEYEEEEEFRLVLGSPRSESPFGASIGEQNETLVKIKDDADKPIIKFAETKFSVNEPKEAGQVATVRIAVVRTGDVSKLSVVRVHTKDGSATSGEDYHPISEEIEFKEGDREHFVEVEVLYDGVREMREAFTVHLKPDENMVAETQMNKAIVYIEEMNSMADVTFPSVPHVVSLLLYDDTARARESPHPPAGYPIVCVTACNPKYSDYDKTGSLCASENINDTLTRYRWSVSAPSGADGVASPMREVDANTFFTSTKIVTLDSVYFAPGSRVQCSARAVNGDGEEGLELTSTVVTVSGDEGLCQPRILGAVGAEPFTAKLRYTGPEDPDYPNLIKLTVTMPHIDGMLPVISTRALSNFELTLSPDGTRVGNHKCSNLVDYDELQTRHGFLTDATKNPEVIGETSPYQYSAGLRSAATLRFYRNLNLEACLWEFVSFYDMSELLTECGGSIGTDGQVLNLVQSYVTLRVPLYVSYVFHSPVGVGGWQHFDLQSDMRLTFVYDTAILWKDGIGSPPEAELQGALYPTSMRINGEGRLVVNFRTEARFRGQYVMAHPGTPLTSMVMSADHPGLTFTLSLVRSEPSYHQPEQQWSFISDFAVRDYSGTYTVKLVPCTSAPSQEYSIPIICNPREPLTFDLDIRFQQVSDPVAAEFSLNTLMFLLSKKALWISDGSMGFGEGSDVAFTEGAIVYGRVMVDPVQNLGDSFICNIEKVFLCTGADGYVPKYFPENREYGCLADSPSLLYRFKILDKAQPETQAHSFGNVPFNARLAADDPEALPLVRQPGSDGFRVDSSPLFQVTAGREWYIHTIYTVRSHASSNRGIGKRSVEYAQHSLVAAGAGAAYAAQGSGEMLAAAGFSPAASQQRRQRRDAAGGHDAPPLVLDIGASNNRGTNMQHIVLDRSGRRVNTERGGAPADGTFELAPSEREPPGNVTPVVTVLAVLVLAVCVLLTVVLLMRRRRQGKKEMKKEAVANGNGSSEPMVPKQACGAADSSEV